MDRAVITQKLLELIAGSEIKAALFTTYTFEPDFFELDVIPVLLSQNVGYSEDDRVKRCMVRENLREADLPIDVYYDAPMFRRSGSCSPEMEYSCHGVNLGNRAFHGKVSMILLQDNESGESSLLMGAGSNNLSRAGWWDNIECQHWEEVRNRTSPRRLINILKEELAYLDSFRSFSSAGRGSALERISEFVETCRGSNSADPVHYFGLSYPEYRRSFLKFLQQRTSPLVARSNWHLEIISPFFADDSSSLEHKHFFKSGVVNIKLMLPRDKEDAALCQDAYYRHIEQEENICWAQWREDVARSLGLGGDCFRPLHAKVYHFYNKQQSWAFVGSVNFTHKAIHENVEAGFLVKLPKAGPLLEPIPEDKVVEQFAPPEEAVPGEAIDDGADAVPEIHLCYDWVEQRLVGRTSKNRSYEIQIIGAEGDPVIDGWAIQYQETNYEGDVARLEETLKSGSLLRVRGRNPNRQGCPEFPEHLVLLQQVGWSHKPVDLPELSAAQILAIYAGMSPERRQLMLIDAKIRALVLSAQGGELTVSADEEIVDQFFSEYAEIFNAFAKLGSRLQQALDSENFKLVDYYLTGAGVDSMTSLITRALDEGAEGNSLAAVSCYLLMLSALEIYQDDLFKSRPNVQSETAKLTAAINALRNGERMILDDNCASNRRRFFAWFEEEFFCV